MLAGCSGGHGLQGLSMSFSPFLDNAAPASQEIFSFQADTALLKEAAASVRLAAGAAKDGTAAIRCTVFSDRLKLAAYSKGVFAEEIMPLAGAHDVPDPGVSFVLDLGTLGRIVGAFPKGTLSCAHDAPRRLFTVSESRAKIELATLASNQHIDYAAKLGFPNFVSAVPVDLLRQGMRYASLFTPVGREAVAHVAAQSIKYAVRLSNGSAGEVEQGLVVGGSSRAVLAFQSPSLRSLALHANQNVVDFAAKALARLDPSCTELYQTASFFIMLDKRRMFGLEKPVKNYPTESVEKHIRMRPNDRVQAPRAALRAALARVSAVSDRNKVVQLVVAGEAEAATLTIRMTDPSGRMAEDVLPVVRVQVPGLTFGRPREALLNLSMLSTLLAHFQSDKILIGFDEHLVRLYDVVPDATATSVLVCETPSTAVSEQAEVAA